MTRTAIGRASWFVCLSIVTNVLVTTFSEEKLAFLYKDQLHYTAGNAATFDLIIQAPGYLRAFMGAGADLLSFLGSHRRSYYAASWLLMACSMAALASMHDYGPASVGVALVAYIAGGNLMFVIMDAVIARVGNETNDVGRLQAIQQGTRVMIGASFAGPLSGYVTQHWSYAACFGATAIVATCGMIATLLIDEPPRPLHIPDGLAIAERRRTARIVLEAVRSPALWVLVAYIFYLILTPGTNTAKFYYYVDVLHLSKQTIGNLKLLSSIGSVLGIVLFGYISRRLPAYWLVALTFSMDVLGYVIDFALVSEHSAYVVALVNGVIAYLYTLSMITLFARACPRGAEAFVYGLFTGAETLAGTLSEQVGSAVYDAFGLRRGGQVADGWHALLWFGLTMTVLAAMFIPFLPAWTRSSARLDPAPS